MNKIVWIFLILRATTKVSIKYFNFYKKFDNTYWSHNQVSAFIESSEAIEVLDIKAALRSIQPILNEIDWRINFIEKSPLERLEDRVQKVIRAFSLKRKM